MGKVIEINAERWASIFTTGGMTVTVSTRGKVRFDLTQASGACRTLTMAQAMELFQQLSVAFGAEALTGKDEDDGRPDPAG